MKATVIVRLKKEVLDPQGDAVRRALLHMGAEGLVDVRIGKLIEIEMETPAGGSNEALKAKLAKWADALLANEVIEDYEVILP